MNREKIELALEALDDGWVAMTRGILQDMLDAEPSTSEPQAAKESLPKKLFLIDTINLFKTRYAVEAVDQDAAVEHVLCNLKSHNMDIFSETHLSETISSIIETDSEGYLRAFDNDNEQMKSVEASEKFKAINRPVR